MTNTQQKVDLDKTKSKIFSEESPISTEDEEFIKEFEHRCHLKEISNGRIRKYLYQFKKIAKLFDFSFKEADRKEIERLIIDIKQYEGWKESTKRDYRIAIRKLYTVLSDDHEGHGDYPDKVDWITTTRKSNNGKDPEEILSKENIREIVEATTNARDRAFVLGLYESGCRIGEFRDIKIKHIEFERHGAKLSVDGKTGSRRIKLYMSIPAVKKWLENHPDPDNPESYLWVNRITPSNPQFDNKPLHGNTIRRKLKKIADRAGVSKRVNPHAFRHARATHLASELTGAQMRKFFGWCRGSNVPSRYIHLSNRDVEDAILEMHGVEDSSEEDDALEVFNCPNCWERVSPGEKFCDECGHDLQNKGREDEFEDLMVKFVKKASDENEEVKQVFRELVEKEGAKEIFE